MAGRVVVDGQGFSPIAIFFLLEFIDDTALKKPWKLIWREGINMKGVCGITTYFI